MAKHMNHFGNTSGVLNLASYTVEQMKGRQAALALAADLLRAHGDQLPQAEAVADELSCEAQRWHERAKRSACALSQAQLRTYNHLLEYVQTNGKTPTMTQLAKMDGVSPPSISVRVKAMEKKGVLAKTPAVHGGITILQCI